MIACGHEKTPFGEPLCAHIRNCRTPWIESVKWLVGDGLKTEIVCVPCADDRENGLPVDVEPVCEECYQYLADEIVDLVGYGTWLFSSDETGLSRWDLADGARTGQIPNFRPTHHHQGSHELIQLIDGAIVRWKIS